MVVNFIGIFFSSLVGGGVVDVIYLDIVVFNKVFWRLG